MGYWPGKIFTTLIQYATRVEFGGIVGYRGDAAMDVVLPPMGSGHCPEEGFGKSCLFEMVKFVDGYAQSKYLPLNEATPTSNSPCYKVRNFSNSDNNGNYFYFGGPGGICC